MKEDFKKLNNKIEENLIKSETNLKFFFNSVEDFLFVLSTDGRILKWNDIVLKRLKYSNDELLVMNVFDLHPPERHQEVDIIVKEMIEGKRDTCPIYLILF